MNYKEGDLMYMRCGRNPSFGKDGELFIQNISNYLFDERIFANYDKIDEGIWKLNREDKYYGTAYFYLPEKEKEVRKLCEETLKQLVLNEINYYKNIILSKEKELSLINNIKSDNFNWKNR